MKSILIRSAEFAKKIKYLQTQSSKLCQTGPRSFKKWSLYLTLLYPKEYWIIWPRFVSYLYTFATSHDRQLKPSVMILFLFSCYSVWFCWFTNYIYKTEGTRNLLFGVARKNVSLLSIRFSASALMGDFMLYNVFTKYNYTWARNMP